MDVEKSARERLGPSPSPLAEDANVTSSSADKLPTPRVGADASAPPRGSAAPRPSTPAPAAVSFSEGEAPATPDDVVKVAAPSEQATGAHTNGAQRIETGDDPATMALMTVKEELVKERMGDNGEKGKTFMNLVRKLMGIRPVAALPLAVRDPVRRGRWGCLVRLESVTERRMRRPRK